MATGRPFCICRPKCKYKCVWFWILLKWHHSLRWMSTTEEYYFHISKYDRHIFSFPGKRSWCGRTCDGDWPHQVRSSLPLVDCNPPVAASWSQFSPLVTICSLSSQDWDPYQADTRSGVVYNLLLLERCTNIYGLVLKPGQLGAIWTSQLWGHRCWWREYLHFNRNKICLVMNFNV